MEAKSNSIVISKLSFILSMIILLSDTFAFILKVDIPRTTLFLSLLAGILLYLNGIVHRK